MVSPGELRLLGAKKILLEAAGLKMDESLLILSHENRMNIAQYLLKAAKSIEVQDVALFMIPKESRPIKRVSNMLAGAIEKADVLIYLVDRMPEETHIEWGPLMSLCKKHECRYLTMHDPKPWYLERGGILADYEIVDQKSKKVAAILNESEKIEVQSEIGTNLTLKLDPKPEVPYRSPSILFPEMLTRGHIQVPEGEVSMTPVQDTVNGKLVVDSNGAITGLGKPFLPVTYVFEAGEMVGVEGDKIFLAELCEYVRRSGGKPVLENLDTVEEFAVGTNPWAVLDDNVSNCEKVAGTIHFGIGHQKEWQHIDHVVTSATVVVTDKKGDKIRLVEKGRLMM